MAAMSRPLLLDVSSRGTSCARTICAAVEDIREACGDFKPEVIHIVGAGDAELSLDFGALAGSLASGARVLLLGPHARVAGGEASEELLGPVECSGLQVSVFPHTYQRYMALHHDAEAPQLVVLFHPGLDIHYFTWYPCLKHWVDSRIPVILTAYKRPAGLGETPALVKTLLDTLVGSASAGNPAGLFVMEEENPHCTDEDGSFNAGYFVFMGSQGALPILPEEMYFGIYQALSKVSYPFAPRVGYLDVSEEDGRVDIENPRLLASIAEGALRAALSGDDAVDEETARAFAARVLDGALGQGIGARWQEGSCTRPTCANCREGYDSQAWHLSICPAVGAGPAFSEGDAVVLANLSSAAYNGREGTLESFNRQKQRWVVRMGEKQALFKAVNLQRKPAST